MLPCLFRSHSERTNFRKIITACCKNIDVIQIFVQVAENISLFVASNYHYTILLKKIQEKNFKRA